MMIDWHLAGALIIGACFAFAPLRIFAGWLWSLIA